MKIVKKALIYLMLVVVVLASILISPKAIKAAGSWWDDVTIKMTESSTVKKIYIDLPNDSSFSDRPNQWAFRLTVDGRTITPQEYDNFSVGDTPTFGYSSDFESFMCTIDNGGLKIDDQNIFRYADSTSENRQYSITGGTNGHKFILRDSNPPQSGHSRKYAVEIFGYKRVDCYIGESSTSYSGFFKAKNIAIFNSNPNPPGSDEDIKAKILQLNKDYQHWRDLLTGNCGKNLTVAPVSQNIDPFLMQITPSCAQQEAGETDIASNEFWDKTNPNFFTQELANKLQNMTLGIFGSDMPSELTFQGYSLTPRGDDALSQIDATADSMKSTVDLLDQIDGFEEKYSNLTNKIIIRKWNYENDNKDNVFETWSAFKEKFDTMFQLAKTAIDTTITIPGEEDKGTCMNALTLGNIQIIYFIGCLFNSLGDFLIDTATKFFLNFGGL